MRTAEIIRNTAETKINLKLTLEGTGAGKIQTGCGFLDHMLTLFAKHGRFDLDIACEGDTWVDDHHTVEDVGIALGQAFAQTLGEKRGINRYGSQILPMDESLVLCAVDFSGRAYLGFELPIPSQKIGAFDSELVEEFWLGFVRNAQSTLHIRLLTGSNSHHIVEGAFKAAGRALRAAVAIDPACSDEIPSTKGVL
ncbi:MAG: imidazoleglycerol-phosphate dehydratase HisB [Oscillospiraceae bacterium]|nr:imidazoleglycerol-phosphate dehydratase HisB [Oscillospiraceae bacterium]